MANNRLLMDALMGYADSGKLVAFYKWEEGDSLLVGYVKEIGISEVTFSEIDSRGQPDGETTVPFDSLYRLDEAPAYMERLRLFSTISPPSEKVHSATTQSPKVIARRLREATSTGECVSLQLKGSSRQDFQILRADGGWFEVDEYADNPLCPMTRTQLCLGQIQEMRWRGYAEKMVTALWQKRDESSLTTR